MRYNELLIESAARELAEKLPTLSHHTYNSIDKLMQHISAKHKISGKKLHDLFVHKYGHTPDIWIKKLKHKLGEEDVQEGWSEKYKRSIDCSHPKGFSQKAHCAGKKKHNESIEMEMVCPDCGMCETHSDHENLDEACWKGYHKEGNKKMFGKTYPNCVKNEDVVEGWKDLAVGGAMALGALGASNAQTADLSAFNTNYLQSVVDGTAGRAMVSVDDAKAELQARANGKQQSTTPEPRSSGRLAPTDYQTKEPLRQGTDGKWYNSNGEERDSMHGGPVKNGYATMRSLRPLSPQVTDKLKEEKCPHCNGPMFSEMMINEKKDACYYKVKSRYKVWPSAYASGALVKCRKKGASNWGNSTKNESIVEESVRELEENLHQWFKEKWVRFGPDGKIRGDCARGDDSEGKPKCLPQSKAHSLGKKGRASAAARKRREDPNPERHGKAINVNTKKKTSEQVNEISDEKLQGYLSRADRQVSNRLGNIGKARERLNKGYEIYRAEDPNHPIEHFTANTPEEARKYYHNYIDKYESDVDFDLRLRKSTGLGESALKESVDSSDDVQKIKDFIKWSIKQLHIQKPYPKITLSRNTKVAQQGHHTGVHTEDNKIWVYIENRNLIDIFRTIFHELVHERQSQLNMIKDGDSYPGSPIEAMADMVAGKYIKIYGKDHPEIFQ